MGKLITVSADVIFRTDDYDLMLSKIKNAIMHNDRISLAEVRDLFKTSRKYAQAILEHLDTAGVTVRDGDFRKLKKP
jgi:selenocysteine-specific elongation factor